MAEYQAPSPIPTPTTFNYNYFTDLEGNLTLENADKRYLKISGGTIGYLNVLTNLNVLGDYYKNSLLVNLDAITGITNGSASANRALILDSSKNISGINDLSITGNFIATNLSGILQTPNQSNITTVGTLNNLTLDMAGIGLNTPALKFNGTSFNQDLYLNIIEGGASASKAVVLNSNKDYSGINDLSITGDFIASTSIASPLITATDINLSGTITGGTISCNTIALTPTTRTISTFSVDGVLWYSNSSRHFGVRQIGSDYISLLSYSAGGVYGDYITWLHNSGSPLCSIDCNNLSVPNSILANNLRIQDSIDDTRFISCLDNNMASGGSKAIAIGRFNAINQQAEISYKYSSTIGNSVLNLGHHTNNVQVSIADNGRIAFGGNADTLTGSRVYSIGSTSFVNGSYQGIHEFRTANNANKILIEMNPSGDSFIGTSTANKFCFMYNRGRRMTIDNELTTSDNPINITGDFSYTINTGGGLYSRMNTANSSYSNTGSVTSTQWSLICIGFINCSQIYMTSDRRMKENIEILNDDYADKLYDQQIYSYNYKNKTNRNIGFIAQDLLKDGYINLLAFSPNRDLKKESQYDIEGTQINLNYDSITICNVMMIKKLIKRINILEEKLNRNNIV